VYLQAALLPRGGLGLGHHPDSPHGPGAHHRHAVQVGGEHKVHLLLHIVPQCLSHRPNWDPPPPLPHACVSFPRNQKGKGTQLPTGEGVVGSHFGRLEKKHSKKHFILCGGVAFQLFRKSRVLQHNCAFYNGCITHCTENPIYLFP
jgi:hypothetical protein